MNPMNTNDSQTAPESKSDAFEESPTLVCSRSSEFPDRVEETWRADAGWARADAAEFKLRQICEKAEESLSISWLYSGKEAVQELMREIAAISSENACLSHEDGRAAPPPQKL